MSEINTIDGKVRVKNYIRSDISKQVVHCRNCSKDIIRRDLRTIVYYCSPTCRKAYRKGI